MERAPLLPKNHFLRPKTNKKSLSSKAPIHAPLTVSTDAMEADDLEGALFFEMLRRPRKKSEKDWRPGSDDDADAGDPRFRSSSSPWGPMKSD